MSDDRFLSRRDALKLGLGAGALLSLNRREALALAERWSRTGAAPPDA